METEDYGWEIIDPIHPDLIPAPLEEEVRKHQEHDQSTHGNWATGGEISTWNPKDPIPESPRNAGGMTAKSWEAWEHGPDGQNFIALFRKYAAQELGLEVPKTPFDPGEYLNYMMDRGWGKPSREEAKGMLNAIANGRPQPALYRGMTDSTDPEEQKSFDALLSTKPGDTFDMPLVSTTRSVGVATWYAADVMGVGEKSVVMKIQDGAKGVSLKKENSVYPQDHEVITSGKFEVVSVSKVSIPYWSRGIFEPRKNDYKEEYGGTTYEVATYAKKTYSPAESKIAYEAVQSGNLSSLETPDFKLTDDRASKGSLSSWTREPAKEFTVIEVKMVEPHTVQKAKDYGNEFFFLFNNMPFIHDGLEDVQKHGEHDQKTHGNWSTGGTVYTSIIDRLGRKDVTGFSLDISSRSEPTSGYMCSNNGAEKTVEYKDFFSSRDRSREILLDYIEKNADALSERGAYFGIWVVKDRGTVYLDVSRRYDSRGEAVRAGFDNDQQSVYDIEKDEYIYMKDEEDDRTRKAVVDGGSNPRQSDDPRTEESVRGGDSQRNRKESPHVCLGRYQGVEKHLEGQHDQATHGSWASGRFGPDSVKAARDGAKEYAFKAGIKQDDSIDYQKTVANRARAARIADAYDELPVKDEKAFESYTALATEVEAQFDYMTKTMGVKVEFVADDPYKTSREMFADVSKGVLKVLSTASTGSHPFFKDEQNDKFRAVHDFFGHAATGRGFGQDGEESAWVHHSQMFTETARAALTTETRGQNSWYNTRGQGFAEQKVALLPEEFWQVPKTFEKSYKVIRFQPGLIPVLKHGTHTQADHGNWARGISAEDEALINEMEPRGPSLADLENLLQGADQPGLDDLKTMVENDSGLYEQAIFNIEERVAAAVEEKKYEYEDQAASDKANEELYNRLYEQIQSEMIDEYIESDDGTIAQMWMDQNGGGLDPEEALPFFQEVYNLSHDVIGKDGERVTTLDSDINDVRVNYDSIEVFGEIVDSQNEFAGEFTRTFSKEYKDDGEPIWVVEHDIFKMANEYEGVGFGKTFIAQQEAWYTAVGIDRIDVGTAWDGARHWAGAGFDFDAKSMDRNAIALADGLNTQVSNYGRFEYGSPERVEFDSLMSKMVTGYSTSQDNGVTYVATRKITDEGFPIPNDFAMIGYKDKVEIGRNEITGRPIYEWAGAQLLYNMNLKYQKGLTKEGRSINQGPIDRDGDGLVYDGTPREKPAPVVN